MSYYFLASPYHSADKVAMEKRYLQTKDALAALLQQGRTVFSPIVMCHPVAVEYNLGLAASDWEEFDYNFLSTSMGVLVLMLPGWEDSIGVQGEIATARSLSLPVEYVEPVSLGILA